MPEQRSPYGYLASRLHYYSLMSKIASRPRQRPSPFAALGKRLTPAPMPPSPKPMLCTLVADPFDNPKWLFEPKFDGVRILGRFDGKSLTLLSRYGDPQNVPFPDIAEALQKALRWPAIVDGEVVCFDDNGHTSFRSLQQRFHLQNPKEIAFRQERYPAYYYLFDLLYIDRYDVTGLPLEERKELLRQTVQWSSRICYTESIPECGKELFRQACADAQEGIIGKFRDSRYVSGRSSWWVKVKCIGRQEFVIGGYTDPQHSRVGLGALLVGYYDEQGKQLLYAGKVGTGFNNETLFDLRRRLEKLEQQESPFVDADPPRGSPIHWIRPKLVAEIAFAEWTQHGHLRQPRYQGLRVDKKPKDCKKERPKR
ncbi:MAG TPA: non-homologous end-joining DNA ligase [Gemmataceae bacterium]|nr:non-homologous end-joining DNA ligase [Gemmataceae bacterium]